MPGSDPFYRGPGDHDPGQAESLAEVRRELAACQSHNQRMASTLREAREQIVQLKAEVDRLAEPPSGFGTFIQANEDGTVDINASGRKMRVVTSPAVSAADLRPGQEVMLNDSLNIIGVREYERSGEVVMFKERLETDRVLVIGRTDDEKVVRLAEPLQEEKLRAGDSLLLDARSGYVLEKIPKAEVEELVLEEIPDVGYDNIGGLGEQIEMIRDAVELPFLHADLFSEHQLAAPKGILLYGPPGCGKTLIAKAVASSLAKKVAEVEGRDDARSYFLNIKGPELLNKYVGETERHIRLVFQRAREKASEGMPVIDGVEGLEHVIVIGASNREDMIDPAILRPGRLDVKIKIERPDAQAAADIFGKYLVPELPLHAEDLAENGGDPVSTCAAMIRAAVERMYSENEDNRFLEVTYANGDKEVLYFKDFNSGAMIENIVARAKKMAIKDLLDTGQRGVRVQHLLTACVDEFRENEDLPNTTNPDDWARISGKKGERIVFIRTLVRSKEGDDEGRSIDTVGDTGQYL